MQYVIRMSLPLCQVTNSFLTKISDESLDFTVGSDNRRNRTTNSRSQEGLDAFDAQKNTKAEPTTYSIGDRDLSASSSNGDLRGRIVRNLHGFKSCLIDLYFCFI